MYLKNRNRQFSDEMIFLEDGKISFIGNQILFK